MPKILRVLNRLVIGGPAFNACYLTKYMPAQYQTKLVVGAKEGHEIDSPLPQQLGLNVHTIAEMKRAISPINDYQAYKKMKALIQAYKPDIVHTHAAKSGAIGRLAAAACKVPVIVHTFHGHVFHSYFGKAKTNLFIQAERYLAKKTNCIVTISPIQQQEIVEQFKIVSPEKCTVIPLGLDLKPFANDITNNRNKCRTEFKIDDDTIAIGIIGRLVPIKNHNLFLDIAAALKKATSKKIKFIIIGNGESRQAIENYAQTLNLNFTNMAQNNPTANILFAGWRTDLSYVYAGLDIVLLTSKNEGTPVSLIEAQSAFKPVLSTNVGGVLNIIKNNETGYVINEPTATAFMQPLLNLINNKTLRNSFGILGHSYVNQNFSYTRLVNNMDVLYKKLLNT